MNLAEVLEAAVACHQADDLIEAERLYREALSLDPKQPDALNLLGVIFHQRGNYQQALTLFDQAIAVTPEFSVSYFNKGNVYKEISDTEGAKASYEAAIKVEPNFVEARLNLAALLQQEKNIEKATAHYKLILSHQVNEPRALYNLGKALARLASIRKLSPQELKSLAVLNALLRARDPGVLGVTDNSVFNSLAGLAVAFGKQGQQEKYTENLRYLTDLECTNDNEVWIKSWAYLSLGSPDKAFSFAANALNALPYDEFPKLTNSIAFQKHRDALPPVTGRWPRRSKRPLIFTAATGDYVAMFGQDFIVSALEKSPSCDVHIHVINPSQFQFDPQSSFSEFTTENVTWTMEDIGPRTKTVYAGRRFIRFPDLLKQTQRQVICLDIDSVINGDILKHVQSHTPFDALVYERPDEIHINQIIYAGFFAVAPTDIGMRFAEFVAAHILHFEVLGTEKWFLDQIAILAAKIWFEANMPEARIKHAPSHFVEWSDFSSNSLIMTAKGEGKRRILTGLG